MFNSGIRMPIVAQKKNCNTKQNQLLNFLKTTRLSFDNSKVSSLQSARSVVKDTLASSTSLARCSLSRCLWSTMYGGVPFGSMYALFGTSLWIGVASKW